MILKNPGFFLIGALAVFVFNTDVCAASLISEDLLKLNKDQKRELAKMIEHIRAETHSPYLENKKDSLQTSLVTHDAAYTLGQKAYKRLLIEYINQQLEELSSKK